MSPTFIATTDIPKTSKLFDESHQISTLLSEGTAENAQIAVSLPVEPTVIQDPEVRSDDSSPIFI